MMQRDFEDHCKKYKAEIKISSCGHQLKIVFENGTVVYPSQGVFGEWYFETKGDRDIRKEQGDYMAPIKMKFH